jgi:hypothetical protein
MAPGLMLPTSETYRNQGLSQVKSKADAAVFGHREPLELLFIQGNVDRCQRALESTLTGVHPGLCPLKEHLGDYRM